MKRRYLRERNPSFVLRAQAGPRGTTAAADDRPCLLERFQLQPDWVLSHVEITEASWRFDRTQAPGLITP